MRPLARPFTEQDYAGRDDRARLAGSLALSTPGIRPAYLSRAPRSTSSLVLRRRIYAFRSNVGACGHAALVAVSDPSMWMDIISGPYYWPVAALNLTTSSAGTRPRSFTSMP